MAAGSDLHHTIKMCCPRNPWQAAKIDRLAVFCMASAGWGPRLGPSPARKHRHARPWRSPADGPPHLHRNQGHLQRAGLPGPMADLLHRGSPACEPSGSRLTSAAEGQQRGPFLYGGRHRDFQVQAALPFLGPSGAGHGVGCGGGHRGRAGILVTRNSWPVPARQPGSRGVWHRSCRGHWAFFCQQLAARVGLGGPAPAITH